MEIILLQINPSVKFGHQIGGYSPAFWLSKERSFICGTYYTAINNFIAIKGWIHPVNTFMIPLLTLRL
jgi:hypothetical protein